MSAYEEARKAACKWCAEGTARNHPQWPKPGFCTAPTLEAFAEQQAAAAKDAKESYRVLLESATGQNYAAALDERDQLSAQVATLTRQLLDRNSELAEALSLAQAAEPQSDDLNAALPKHPEPFQWKCQACGTRFDIEQGSTCPSCLAMNLRRRSQPTAPDALTEAFKLTSTLCLIAPRTMARGFSESAEHLAERVRTEATVILAALKRAQEASRG